MEKQNSRDYKHTLKSDKQNRYDGMERLPQSEHAKRWFREKPFALEYEEDRKKQKKGEVKEHE